MEGIAQMFQGAWYWYGLLLTAAIVVIEHLACGGPHAIERWRLVLRYGMGVFAFSAPLAVWCVAYQQYNALVAYASFVTVAGATTVIMYLIDGERMAQNRGADLQDVGYPDGPSD